MGRLLQYTVINVIAYDFDIFCQVCVLNDMDDNLENGNLGLETITWNSAWFWLLYFLWIMLVEYMNTKNRNVHRLSHFSMAIHIKVNAENLSGARLWYSERVDSHPPSIVYDDSIPSSEVSRFTRVYTNYIIRTINVYTLLPRLYNGFSIYEQHHLIRKQMHTRNCCCYVKANVTAFVSYWFESKFVCGLFRWRHKCDHKSFCIEPYVPL